MLMSIHWYISTNSTVFELQMENRLKLYSSGSIKKASLNLPVDLVTCEATLAVLMLSITFVKTSGSVDFIQ